MSLSLSRVADGLVAVLLAPSCAACGTSLSHPSRGPVCDACWNAIGRFTPPLCGRCGDPLPSWRLLPPMPTAARCARRCTGRPSPLTRSRAIGAYDGTLRAILHAFKYDGCRSLSTGLGACLRVAAADVLADADLVVPVPLHRRRRRRRGFNQARELAARLGVPMVDALRRTRATPSQTDLPADERHENMRERVCAQALVHPAQARGTADRSGGRREHDGRDARGVCGGRARGWRRRRQRGDGSPSRVSTERMTSAATSPFARSPSRRTQLDAAA